MIYIRDRPNSFSLSDLKEDLGTPRFPMNVQYQFKQGPEAGGTTRFEMCTGA